jgi:amiloride-sensitive sodium channel
MINFTYKHCGCVKFSMPRTKDMKVCRYEDIECYQGVARSWPNVYFSNVKQEKEFSEFPCGCMPPCTQIKYTITDKTTVADRNLKHVSLLV